MTRTEQHWKYRATRCAVIGCDRTRRKGWSTCTLLAHYPAGKQLAGAGRIAPISLVAAGDDPEVGLLCDQDHCRCGRCGE